MRVRVLTGPYTGRLGTVWMPIASSDELLVWIGKWLVRLDRGAIVQAMDGAAPPHVPLAVHTRWPNGSPGGHVGPG